MKICKMKSSQSIKDETNDNEMIDLLLQQNKTLMKQLNNSQKNYQKKLDEINQKLTKCNPINMTNNYNDIKVLNIYTMKPVELLNKFCKNNPPSDGVIKYLEKRGIKSCEEDRLLIAHNAKNLDFVAVEIDKILKNCNKELIESANICENTCDGILFSNDGSCRKHIVKGPTNWLYINDEKILDKAVSQILDKATLRYGIQMNYIKKIRGQIIKKEIIKQAKIEGNLNETKLILDNLDNYELQKRIESVLENYKNKNSNGILSQKPDIKIIEDNKINNKELESTTYDNENYLSVSYGNRINEYDEYSINLSESSECEYEEIDNKILYNKNKEYIKKMDCGKEYLLEIDTLNGFSLETKEYKGKFIHEENCPINHCKNCKITEKCWTYLE